MSVDHDFQAHLDTWHGFLRFFFCLGGFVILLLALMAFFLL